MAVYFGLFRHQFLIFRSYQHHLHACVRAALLALRLHGWLDGERDTMASLRGLTPGLAPCREQASV